jgi:hypothetical protein
VVGAAGLGDAMGMSPHSLEPRGLQGAPRSTFDDRHFYQIKPPEPSVYPLRQLSLMPGLARHAHKPAHKTCQPEHESYPQPVLGLRPLTALAFCGHLAHWLRTTVLFGQHGSDLHLIYACIFHKEA